MYKTRNGKFTKKTNYIKVFKTLTEQNVSLSLSVFLLTFPFKNLANLLNQ